MMSRVALLLPLAVYVGCSSGGSASVEVTKVFVEDERSPEKSSGWCARCNMTVFDGHRCGLTVPCQLCQREAGARHLHEVAWRCDYCDIVVAKQHECRDSKTCPICRQGDQSHPGSLLHSIGCERCSRQMDPIRLVGITSYCGTCNQEVGANHVHHKTVFCLKCLREAGKNHICDATRFCYEHGEDEMVDHWHGSTVYCPKCHREAGVDHKHGVTEWCWICKAEKEWPHCHHD